MAVWRLQIVKRSGFPQRLVTIGCDRQPPALALLHGQADAFELDLGTRFPAMPNEEIVVRNDGGVRKAGARLDLRDNLA